ncbi:MAG TPA: alpha/beta fold hydrolase [Fimbriimonas sp.]|nr:alpha/beta fold hydrolase [Fimbriimonas sp.]
MRCPLTIFVLLTCLLTCRPSPLPRHGTLALTLRAAPADLLAKLKLGPQEAIQVTTAANGLEKDDLIVRVDGKRFKSFAEYGELLRCETLKDRAELTILRNGKSFVVVLKVQPRVSDSTPTYDSQYEEVLSNGHRIRMILTRPKSPGRHPVFFYIQGINLGSIDFPLSATNYVASLLRGFANDYVTVRVEKTGVGDSEGGPARLVGFNEEADIYRQALKALPTYDFVDPQNIYIFGHSMGGCHAPLVCTETPVKGIVSYGTVANSWLEWEVRSPRIQEPLAGKSSAEVDQEIRKLASFYHYLYNEKRSMQWIKRNHPELRAMAQEASPDNVMLGDRSIRYMQEVNDHNFCEAWAKQKAAHVLALFGENDWISLMEDQTQVADSVNKARPGVAVFKVVPASDHLFNKCKSMQDSYDRFGKPGTEFNPAIATTVKEWIASLGS